MNAPRLEPGTVLAGKYRLEEPLGEGGMGTVYRAEHLMLKAPVAVKVVDRDAPEGDVAVARFMREAQAAASLRSPHVVQILDYGTEGPIPFIVMELLEGETLADRLSTAGRLGPAEAFKILSHIARAIGKAHEANIIHRDLKPDNVFLIHNEGDFIAKVLDFGVAKVDDQGVSSAQTRTGSLLGTPYYMSPEQAQGNKEVDYRSDLWALGVIAFECLTGKRPFSSDGLGDLVIQICIRDIPLPSSLAPVPPLFDEWFLRAVAREPDARFQSARLLIEALSDALGIVREMVPSAPDAMAVEPIESVRRAVKKPVPAPIPTETPDPEPSRPFHERTPAWAEGATDLGPASVRSRQSEWRTGPLMPRHAVADTIPAPAPLARSVWVLGLASMLLGGLVIVGMRQMGFLPDVSAWFETPHPTARKKTTSKSLSAKSSPAAKTTPETSKPSEATKKSLAANKAPSSALPTLNPRIQRATQAGQDAPAPGVTSQAPPPAEEPKSAVEPSPTTAEAEPSPIVPPELAPDAPESAPPRTEPGEAKPE